MIDSYLHVHLRVYRMLMLDACMLDFKCFLLVFSQQGNLEHAKNLTVEWLKIGKIKIVTYMYAQYFVRYQIE